MSTGRIGEGAAKWASKTKPDSRPGQKDTKTAAIEGRASGYPKKKDALNCGSMLHI